MNSIVFLENMPPENRKKGASPRHFAPMKRVMPFIQTMAAPMFPRTSVSMTGSLQLVLWYSVRFALIT